MRKQIFTLVLLGLICSVGNVCGTNPTYEIAAPDQNSYTDATSGITAVGTYTTAKIDNVSSSKVFSVRSQQPLYITSVNANIKGIQFDYVLSSSGSGTENKMNIYTAKSSALAVPTSGFTASYTPAGSSATELASLSNIPVSKVQTSHYTFSLTLNSAVSTLVIASTSSNYTNIRNISIIYDDAISAPSLYATITPSGTANSWNVTSGKGSMAAAGITATSVTINDASYYKLDGTSTYTPAQSLIPGDVVVFNIGYTSSKTLGIKVPSSEDAILVDKGIANQPYQIVYVVPSISATLSFQRSASTDYIKDIQVYHYDVVYETYDVTYTSTKGVAPSSKNDVYCVTLSEITGVDGWKNTGWIADKTTTVNSSNVSAGTEIENGSTVYLTDDTEFSAVWVQLYDVTKGTYTNGGFTISPTKAEAGETVTLTATPSSGYAFVGWQIVKTSDSKDITGLVSLSDAANPKATFTMPGYGVTVNATFAAPNIYYYKDETHYSGGSYKNPEGETASSGDDNSLSTSWTICNACVVGVESVIAKNCTYDGKGSYVDAYIKIPTGGDKDSKNITFKISDGYSAVLKMKMGPWSGTPTITFKKLEGGTLGDNIAYTGTIGGNAQSENTFNELTWSIPSGGTYVMTVTTKNTYVSQIDIQTTQVVTVTDAQYATYYNEKAYVMPTGLEGYAVTAANTTTGALTLAKAYDAGDVVIANEPLVLHATSVLDSETSFTLNNTSESGSNYPNNLLSGERDGNGKTIGGTLYYRLSYTQNDYSDIGFYWGAAGGAAFEIAKGKAYLPLNAGANAPSRFLFTDQEDNATNIENIEASDKAIKFIENGQLLILRDGIVYDALGRKIR